MEHDKNRISSAERLWMVHLGANIDLAVVTLKRLAARKHQGVDMSSQIVVSRRHRQRPNRSGVGRDLLGQKREPPE